MELKLSNDFVFKAVFGQESDNGNLINLLNALLEYQGGDEIREIAILNPHTNITNIKDKLGILDIRAKDGNGKHYNIEMQIDPGPYYFERILFYEAKLYSGQIRRGKDYHKIKKTISLSIIAEKNILKEEEKIHNIYMLKNVESDKILTDLVEFHFIELQKFGKKKLSGKMNRFDKWIYLLSNTIEELDKSEAILNSEEGIKMAIKTFKSISKSELERQHQYDIEKAELDGIWRLGNARREGLEKGREEGKEEGLAKGRAEGKTEGSHIAKVETAKELKKLGFEIEIIVRATGLSFKEVERL